MPCIYLQKHSNIQASQATFSQLQEHNHLCDGGSDLLNQSCNQYNVCRLCILKHKHKTSPEAITYVDSEHGVKAGKS